MGVFNCKMCGGSLDVTDRLTVTTCGYCGTKQTVSNADDEKRINLFNRANRLRMNSEFDKAGAIYEQIIAEFPEEAEAYWGLCLCNYGIEYVDSPATGAKIPTVHRASFEIMRIDENYELALEYADSDARAVYQAQAKEIDRIMGEILTISSSEKPYDIFICYKEKDSDGNRTPDSVIAQDIYEELTKKGYKVFFSRITLEDKLGMHYEPYIFAALNSARIMLAVGTDYEYYNAVWVKNEWSRFIKLAAKDKSKVLIPCFKDMGAYEIPKQFRGLQAQNMGRLGFMQDLLRGIDKIFGKEKTAAEEHSTVIVKEQSGSPSVNSLLERVFMFLEDGKFKDADEYCERVLDIEPRCARAYLGKLMAELGVRTEDKLKDAKLPFDENDNCIKVCRFDSSLTEKFKADNAYIRERNIYDKASQAAAEAKTDAQFNAAAAEFEKIPGFKDSDVRAADCRKKAEEAKIEAERKAEEARLEAERKAEEERLEAERKAEEARLEAERKAEEARLEAERKAKEERLEAERRKREFELKVESVAAALKNTDIKSEQQALETQLAGLQRLLDGFDTAADRLSELKTEAAALQKKCSDISKKISSLGLFKIKEKSELSAKLSQAKAKLNDVKKEYAEIVSRYGKFDYKEKLAAAVKAKQTELEKLIESKSSGTAEYSFDDARRLYEFDEQLQAAISAKYPEIIISLAKECGYASFGSYPQTADGIKKPIEWLVLERTDKTALLVSKCGLDCKKYNDTESNVTWESCSLRKWLNGEFLDTAFTPAQQAVIALSDVSADENPKYSTSPGKATKDKIFLLSIPEAEKYFKTDEARLCAPTAYSEAHGAYTNTEYKTTDGEAACWWWLRSPGYDQGSAAYVDSDGSVYYYGYDVDADRGCVRPALRINLDS